MTCADIALQYNDQSVLENMHAATLFSCIRADETANILAKLPADQRTEARKLLIEMILATDMGKHFEKLAAFQTTRDAMSRASSSHQIDVANAEAASPQPGVTKRLIHLVSRARITSFADTADPGHVLEPRDRNDLVLMLQVCLHTADISNPAKPLVIAKQWTQRVVEEFFQQGDRERELGLPVTNFFDREHPNTPKQQVGFIDFIVRPTLQVRGFIRSLTRIYARVGLGGCCTECVETCI